MAHQTLAPVTPSHYCYDEPAKRGLSLRVRRFFNRAHKDLGEFSLRTHFNPGGIAVWGEVYAQFYLYGPSPVPVVEAYNTSMGILVRQWDGYHSGRNCYVKTLGEFVELVRSLAYRPFVRF